MGKRKLRRLLAESYHRHDAVEAEYQSILTDNDQLQRVLTAVREDLARALARVWELDTASTSKIEPADPVQT